MLVKINRIKSRESDEDVYKCGVSIRSFKVIVFCSEET